MPKIDQFLELLLKHEGSDLHLSCGSEPVMRVHGHLQRVKFRPLTAADLKTLFYEILSEGQKEQYEATMDLDFAYEIPGAARFRGNFFNQHRGPAAVFRIIPSRVLTADELGLPEPIRKFTELNKGLVLVTGPTGSGKSTTLAAMIDLINQTRPEHILTIEDPIEFVHQSQRALVNQREVGPHTKSFATALKAALREDPDVILIGEMRDRETISLALTAAETGHLVFGTLHTNSAHKTVDRIIDTFPGELQHQVRAMLSESLRGVVAQQLLRKKGGKGRVAAHEILVGTPAVSNLIREAKTFQIPSSIQTGKRDGMILMDQSIMNLMMAGTVDADEAYSKALDKAAFQKQQQG
ncbi:MAG: Twitching motility protein PilT [uncultured Gemmatimonadetes bacterium]|uniref:Twitching motility protein PilT n=1 Tax=uncultured Gemmatimonadota bacterium TaxID=203437 RepID=A0A6J4M973_9BACT|nr:MAG: Twitching motility protein PilT [uncultured Gemmatimonadota bacterium]